jgi:hypothetical protein
MTSQLETSRNTYPPRDSRNDTTVVQVACAAAALAVGFAFTVWIATLAGNPNSASNPTPTTTGQASRPAR